MINFISEWQPTTLADPSHYIYFILIIFIMFIGLFSKKKIQFIDFALFGISVFLGLKSIRFWFYTYIIMSYVVFNYIPERKPDKGTTRMFLVLGSFFLLVFIDNIYKFNALYNKKVLSSKMIEIIKNESPDKLYNLYDYGGELVYNDIEVFVDGRADLYSKYNLSDYEMISMLQGDYIKLIKKYEFDYFLVSKGYPINTYLSYSDEYEMIFSEEDIFLYKKKDSTV